MCANSRIKHLIIIAGTILFLLVVSPLFNKAFAEKIDNIPVRETDIATSAENNLFVTVKGEFLYQSKAIILKEINRIRLEACTQGVPDPRDETRKLTAADYVPLKWSSDLEWIAQTRAAESSITMQHYRPNGDWCFAVTHNGVDSYAENLAWNYSGIMFGISQWYSEKADWVKQTPGAMVGHYTSLINPDYRIIGIGGFALSSRGWYCIASECSYNEPLSEAQSGVRGIYYQIMEVPSNETSGLKVSGANSMYGDETITLRVSARYAGENVYITNGINWTSSNSSVATVDSKGNVTGKAAGTTVITAKAGGKSVTKTINVYPFDRIYGPNRYDTAMKTADALKTNLGIDKFDTAVIATGTNYPDALTGCYLAKVKNAPMLLVDKSTQTTVKNYLGKNMTKGGKVYLLGGTGVISSDFEKSLKSSGYSVERLSGKVRYDTNLAILKEANVSGEDLLICTGNDFADSLSASAAGKPILLVDKKLSKDQKTYLSGLKKDKKAYLIGGTGVVKDSFRTELKPYATKGITRVAGANRYATSKAVADTFFKTSDNLVLAYAMNFPDGLSGGPLAMSMGAPLMLADDKNYKHTVTYADKAGVKKAAVLGGTSLIPDQVVNKIVQ